MGLFDKLLKEGTEKLKEVTSEENKEKASAFLHSLKETVSEGAEQLKEVAREVTSDENKEKAAEYFNTFKEAVSEGAEAIKEAAREATTEENKEKASAFINSLKGSLEKQAEQVKTEAAYVKKIYEEPEDGKTCRERILEILAAEFPEYTVRENVSPREFNGVGRFMDYSIVVYREGTPKLVIMLIDKTTTSHREYRWSREEAERNNYPFINFVKHYPNTPEYISNRLHQYL